MQALLETSGSGDGRLVAIAAFAPTRPSGRSSASIADGFEVATPVMPLMLKDVTIQGIGTGHAGPSRTSSAPSTTLGSSL